MLPAFPLRALLLLLTLFVGAAPAAAQDGESRLLLFSRTEGFRHASIPAGIAAVEALGAEAGFAVEATEDAAAFTDANLARFDAVAFLSTTGDVLDAEQQAAFERFIRAGGGYAGIHAASDTEYDWAWYGDLVGAYFANHPPGTTSATVHVVDRDHPATAPLPERWTRTDEWYNFQTNPRGQVHVLATLQEDTYSGGTMGADHPITWCQLYDGGRAWYTAGGHTTASYSEPLFLDHLRGGLRYALGLDEGVCDGTVWGYYEQVVLDDEPLGPMDLAVLPDGRVLYVERAGRVRLYDPATNRTTTAATLDVSTSLEDGLLGIALAPDFTESGHLYLFYSPTGSEPVQHVSRFTFAGSTLDLGSEQLVLTIPVQRDQCCHSGGDLAFGPDGLLYIATGDNTNPFESGGYAPIDERPGRAPWDAQRTSANTQDLRGKILRIAPQPDGSYEIPSGNLFADPAEGRPEIYAMGLRNPFRISVDPVTGWLYWGDVGPDASSASPERGPRGYDEWNQARSAGNYGWPYCLGPNLPYQDYDFATGASGPAFDCAAPTNASPNNTGATSLPAARSAWIWYPYGPATAFPGVTDGPGRTAMAGPVYQHDPAAERALPAYYDQALLVFEWSRNWIHEVRLDEDGEVLAIQPFMPDLDLRRPISMDVGPDGALYLLEWGSGYASDNPDARLSRIGFAPGGQAPTARIDASATAGPLPLTVTLDGSASSDPNAADVLSYAWDVDGDGTTDATSAVVTHTYAEAGVFTAELTVTDPQGNTGVATVTITAGNSPPSVSLTWPPDGGFFDWGDVIGFEAGASDPEDGSTAAGTIPCSQLSVQLLTGHDEHSHPLDQYFACEGVFLIGGGHGSDGDNVFQLVETRYTDQGGELGEGLTASLQHRLHPLRLEAEHLTELSGVQLEATGDVLGGGQNVGYIDHGDYARLEPVDLTGLTAVTFRVASAGTGGRIEVRADALDGPLLGTAHVETTGAWQTYRDVTTRLDAPASADALYFVFLNEPDDNGLFNINFLQFHGPGIAQDSDRAEQGLRAQYFTEEDLTGRTIERVDPQINFNWADESPAALIPADAFSARWTGTVRPASTEAYTFYARTDDAVRVWVDGALVIDRWTGSGLRETASEPIMLEAEQAYALRVEYAERTGTAQADLSWSSPSTPKTIVPAARLAPTGIDTGTDPADQPRSDAGLEAPVPSPFQTQVQLAYTLPVPSDVRLDVVDALGRRVALLVEAFQGAGRHVVVWRPPTHASGLYYVRLTTPEDAYVRPLIRLR